MNRKLLAAVVSGTLAVPMAAQVQADEMEVQPHSHQGTYEHDHEMEDGMMSPPHGHGYDAHPHAELHEHSFTLSGSVRSGIYMLAPQKVGDNKFDIGSVDAGDLNNVTKICKNDKPKPPEEEGSKFINLASNCTGADTDESLSVTESGDKLWSRIGVKSSTELDGGMTAGLHIEKRLDNFRTRHQNVWLSGAFGKVTLGQQGSPYHSHTTWDNSNLFGNWNPFTGSRLQGISYASNLGGPFNFSGLVTDDNIAGGGNGSGLDAFEVGGTLSAGPVNLGVGYRGSDGADLMGGKVGGSLGGVGWALAFESMMSDGAKDTSRYGFNVDYSTEAGRAYVYYEDKQLNDKADKNHGNHLLLGYSHMIGPGVFVIAEYQLPSNEANEEQSAVAVRVDF